MKRPYLDKYDRPRVTINTGRWTTEKGQRVPIRESVPIRELVLEGKVPPIFNATALRKEEWLHLDTVVLRAARYRLQAWGDLAKANSFGGFNGMSKMILEHETMSDPGAAFVDMDGLSQGTGDSPLFQLEGLPLPITHSDFWYPARQLAISRNSNTPLDTVMGEAAGRRVAESIEKTTIGNNTGITYGGASTQQGGYGRTAAVYGYLNFPARLTKINLTAPTAGGWSPATTLNDVLAMRNQLYASKFFGPFYLYHSPDWDPYLDADYYVLASSGAVAPSKTLRDRITSIQGIEKCQRLDMLFSSLITTDTTSASYRGPGQEGVASASTFTTILVQMTPDVARAVNGMDITTVQWEEKGGMKLSFKILCISVPQLRADYYSNCLSGDTKILTRRGVYTLQELNGQEVEVLNRFGQWENASVQSFGVQRLHQVNFEHLNPVLATANHRWWQKNGQRVTTTELRSVPFTENMESEARVTSITDTGRDEEVFCCAVPTSESFTLANGLVTSNCGILQGSTS